MKHTDDKFIPVLNGWYQTLLQSDKKNNENQDRQKVLKKWVQLYGGEIGKIRKAYTEDRVNLNFSLVQHAKANFAYLLSFHLPNFARMFRFLQRLDSYTHIGAEFKNQDLNIFDIGCGTGAFAQAFQFYFKRTQAITIDPNKTFLHMAKSVLENSFPDNVPPTTLQLNAHDLDFTSTKNTTVLLIGNLINQIQFPAKRYDQFLHNIEKLVKKPSVIMFVEPAIEKTAKDMMKLRNYLTQKGFIPLYPCTQAHHCPLTGTRDRCYSDYSLISMEPMRFLDLQTGMMRKLLSTSAYCFVSPEFKLRKALPKDASVLVGQPISRGKKVSLLCTSEGTIEREENEKKLKLRGERKIIS